MDIRTLFDALDDNEKTHLYRLLRFWKDKDVLTPLDEFISNADISTRLRNVLINNKTGHLPYLELIEETDILRYRNAGDDTVREFVKAREEYLNNVKPK